MNQPLSLEERIRQHIADWQSWQMDSDYNTATTERLESRAYRLSNGTLSLLHESLVELRQRQEDLTLANEEAKTAMTASGTENVQQQFEAQLAVVKEQLQQEIDEWKRRAAHSQERHVHWEVEAANLQAQIEALRAYAHHLGGCAYSQWAWRQSNWVSCAMPEPICDCGLSTLLTQPMTPLL